MDLIKTLKEMDSLVQLLLKIFVSFSFPFYKSNAIYNLVVFFLVVFQI